MSRRTNLALLSALLVAFATGWMSFGAGTWWGRPVVLAHGVVGLVVVALAPWKSMIARRGLGKKRKGKTYSLLLTVLVVTSLVAGIAHSLGGWSSVAGLTMMQLHVGAALLAVPLVIVHLVRRPTPPRRADLSRRNLLRALSVTGGGALIYAGLAGVARALELPGDGRRFTGSHEVGSHRPDLMPVTQWLSDKVPVVTADHLLIRTPEAERTVPLDELGGEPLRATLDCTGGWYAHQDWTGVPLQRLLAGAEGRSILVRSVTGYRRRFPMRDLEHLFLATGVEGAALSAGHGHPVRLVAPGRRGFWWVKWVDLIEVDYRPWWLQLPFPAQ